MSTRGSVGGRGGAAGWLRRWRSPSLRTRLTLWYGGMFFLAGLVILAVTYFFVRSSLERNEPAAVQAVGLRAGAVAPDKLLKPDPNLDSNQKVDPNQVVQFTNPFTGVTTTVRYRDVPQAFKAAVTDFQQQVQQAEEHRRNRALQALLRRSGAAIGLIGLGAVGLGWLLAGRVLRPINDITATARRVAASSGRGLHERIALGGPQDELKELADTFDDMLERLDESFAGQRRFVDNASHELRTPLAINRTVLEVALADPEASADTRHLARTLLATNDRSQRLIEGLLLLARSDNEVAQRKPVDLAEVGGHVIGLLADDARAAGVDVRHRLDVSMVDGDPILLERMVQNLVQNGIRHNEPGGGGWAQVTTGPEGLVVANSGPVVPSYEVHSLFEPFHRLDNERTRSDRGVGLGLSIVRSIVRAHHGEITAEPRPEGGLTVRVRLPALAGGQRPPALVQATG
jgi:signal transduction histidine kinase